MQAIAFLVIALIALVVVYAGLALKIVRQHEQGLVERFGKFTKLLDPGLQLIVPFIDRVKRVDMREIVVDVPPQEVITKDNVVVTVDARRLLPGHRPGQADLQRAELRSGSHQAGPDEPA